MPTGGKILIETENVCLGGTCSAKHPDVPAGPQVMLAVTDTGTGMTSEVRERIFEPFFTTKPKGKGTGLGLATVYGTVKQTGGSIWVYTEPGHGSTFKIYFPVADAPLPQAQPSFQTDAHGCETVLVVEDEDGVRNLAITALKKYGYMTYGTANADEALAFCRKFPGTIHLLLTHVIMPGMNGRGLADRLTVLRPEVRVLFMSGYTDNALAQHGVLDAGVAYLQKPFTPDALAAKVREVLGPRGA